MQTHLMIVQVPLELLLKRTAACCKSLCAATVSLLLLQEQDKLLTELRSTLGITDAQNHVRTFLALSHFAGPTARRSKQFPSLQWLASESSFCMEVVHQIKWLAAAVSHWTVLAPIVREQHIEA